MTYDGAAQRDFRRFGGELEVRQLVGFHDRVNSLDARDGQERDIRQNLLVSDTSDHGTVLSPGQVRLKPKGLHPLPDMVQLLVGDVVPRDDDHDRSSRVIGFGLCSFTTYSFRATP